MAVLVLNASYEPINVTTVRRAVLLILKEKAEIVESDEAELRSESTTLSRPAVIRLIAYVRIPYGTRKRITRKALFARDDWKCLYCGSSSSLTVDHVVPRSRGGEHEWENLATACGACNHRKGDRGVKEAGMKLRRKPRAPRSDVFVYVAVKAPPERWQSYLAA